MSQPKATKQRLPSKEFEAIMKFTEFCCKLVGTNIYDPNFRIFWLSYLVVTVISLYIVFTFTTVFKFIRTDWRYALEVCCTLGSALQGGCKIRNAFSNAKFLSSNRTTVEKIFAEYELKGEPYREALYRSCSRVRKVLKLFGSFYFTTFFSIVIIPTVLFIFTGRRRLIVHFEIPGLDVNTDVGYFTTFFAHFICMFAGGFGLFAGDLVFVFLLQVFLFTDILKLKIAELNEKSAEDGTKCLPLLKDIISWHKFYTAYNEGFNEAYYYLISIQIITSVLCIMLTLFIVLTGNWLGSYSYLSYSLCGLYLFSIIGTQIETCNDTFCDEIYNIHWYNLPVNEQKMVCQMLIRAQNPSMVKVFGIAPLSVSTSLSITKAIYSFFMMMSEFVME